MLSPSWRQVTHALLTRPPLSFCFFLPKDSDAKFSLDLHVLGTPPAFVLSQDQTLEKISENWLAQFWILTFKVRLKLGIDKAFLTLCNCRNSTALCLYLLPLFSLCTFQTSPLSQESLSIIPRRRSFVKSFFYFFSKKLFPVCCALSFCTSLLYSRGAASPCDNLFILPHLSPFVNTFFHLSFPIFLKNGFFDRKKSVTMRFSGIEIKL